MTQFGDININGGDNINQFGDNNTGNKTTNSSNESDWRPPFDELADKVDDQPWPDETPNHIKEVYETPKLAVVAAKEQIEKDLARPDTDTEPTLEQFEKDKKTWQETFQAMVPMGVKITSAVGMALAGHFTKKTAAGVAAEAFFTTISEMQA